MPVRRQGADEPAMFHLPRNRACSASYLFINAIKNDLLIMAKIFPDLAGGYSGQVGKTLYYRVKKDCFAKTLPERTTPPTEAQSAQQLVFEMMGQLAGMTREVASHGFPKRSKKEKLWSASNVFMHENRGVCTVDDLASRTVTVAARGAFETDAALRESFYRMLERG